MRLLVLSYFLYEVCMAAYILNTGSVPNIELIYSSLDR